MTPAAVALDRAARLLDQAPPPNVAGQLAVDLPPRVCEHGNPLCGAVPVRSYVCGPRCDEHQPAHTRPYHRRPQ
ncbi:aromatic ring-opening dioxygenase LigA [Streptomyces sp. NBC_01180]|uniref:aromatic ring-opening dioxygenase LigA n=1 Tax=Streptomyces sp. NBC_01180 TaxID=2903763 RepID=UPI00386B04DB|nr:aromatic ring-opening dioxygenase LigA [Streptomyces sp. NBC_01180]